MKRIISFKAIAFFFCFIAIILPFAYFISIYNETREVLVDIRENVPGLTTRLYDIHGELISEIFDENRIFIPAGEIPEIALNAFVFAEDRNFFRHTGIDIKGIIRAVAVDIFSGEAAQGGSTITQQLAKQIYTKREKSIRRKIIELLVSRELEKKYSKAVILEMYLNRIYFGHGVYGVAAASDFFLKKKLSSIDIVDAALLASIQSAPNRYSPLRNPREAYLKHRQLLMGMISAGLGDPGKTLMRFDSFWISYLDDVRMRYPTHTSRSASIDKAPHFTEYVRKFLVKEFGEEKTLRGGLEVYTTLDLKLQESASKKLSEKLEQQNRISAAYNSYNKANLDFMLARKIAGKNLSRKNGDINFFGRFLRSAREDLSDAALFASLFFDVDPVEKSFERLLTEYDSFGKGSRVEGAFVAIDVKSGGIRGMVGGGKFAADNQINRAVQSRRQPGSSFKPFVYAAGIDTGKITAASLFIDLPVFFRDSRRTWSPSNYEKNFSGNVLARFALASSLNIVSVLIYDQIGGTVISRYASSMCGVPYNRFQVNPSLALGTSELTPVELARGYSVIASGGIEPQLHSVVTVKDSSKKIIFSEEKKKNNSGKRIISSEAAFIMTSMMRDVVDHGTATGALRGEAGFRYSAAGKTGTSTDFRDAWFCGFTGDISAVVWVGCDSPKFTLGAGQSGSVVSAPVWGKIMKDYYSEKAPSPFPAQPSKIVTAAICSKTGKLPLKECKTRKEYFLSGSVPEDRCDGNHRELQSVFDLIKKNESGILEKEKAKLGNNDINEYNLNREGD